MIAGLLKLAINGSPGPTICKMNFLSFNRTMIQKWIISNNVWRTSARHQRKQVKMRLASKSRKLRSMFFGKESRDLKKSSSDWVERGRKRLIHWSDKQNLSCPRNKILSNRCLCLEFFSTECRSSWRLKAICSMKQFRPWRIARLTSNVQLPS